VRHILTGDGDVVLPTDDCRPTQPIGSNCTVSLISNGSNQWDKGALLVKSRLDGGTAWIGRIALTDGTAVNTATGTPIFYPNRPLPFTPDPAENFKNVKPTSMIVGVSSKTTSTTSAALSGTINAVAFGDFNDLTTTDVSTFPTIAYTEVDYLTASPIYDGVVLVAGPECISNFTQPRVVSNNFPFLSTPASTVVSRRDGAQLVIQGMIGAQGTNTFTLGTAAAKTLIMGLSVNGPANGSATLQTITWNLPKLPNDILDAKATVTLFATGKGTSANTNITFFVDSQEFFTTDSGALTAQTSTLLQVEGSTSPVANQPFTIMGVTESLYMADVTCGKISLSYTSPTTVSLNQLYVTIEVSGYYDRITGPTSVAVWNNVAPGQEIVIEGRRKQQGVSSGSLTQFLKASSSKDASIKNEELHLVTKLFADPKVQWVRRIYTQPAYAMVVASNTYTIQEMAAHLKAAGAFETLGHLLGGLGAGLPIVGPFIQPVLGHVGGFLDNMLGTHGRSNSGLHPGTRYAHTLEPQVVPQSQHEVTDITRGTYLKPLTQYSWAEFPSVCADTNEVIISKVIHSPGPVTSFDMNGEQRLTVYVPVTIVCADDNRRTYYVSKNLTEEDNSLKQVVELLGTLIPAKMYITDPLTTSTSGASYGLALAVAILKMPNKWVYTGVVKVSEEFELQVYPIDFADEKAAGVLSKGRRLVTPVTSIPETYVDEVNTPIDALSDQPFTDIFAVHSVTDILLLPKENEAHPKRMKPRMFGSLKADIQYAADEDMSTAKPKLYQRPITRAEEWTYDETKYGSKAWHLLQASTSVNPTEYLKKYLKHETHLFEAIGAQNHAPHWRVKAGIEAVRVTIEEATGREDVPEWLHSFYTRRQIDCDELEQLQQRNEVCTVDEVEAEQQRDFEASERWENFKMERDRQRAQLKEELEQARLLPKTPSAMDPDTINSPDGRSHLIHLRPHVPVRATAPPPATYDSLYPNLPVAIIKTMSCEPIRDQKTPQLLRTVATPPPKEYVDPSLLEKDLKKANKLKPGDELTKFVLFPTVQRTESDTIRGNLFAVIPADKAKPVKNALTNPRGLRGAKIVSVILKEDKGARKVLYGSDIEVIGRSWEYAYNMLYSSRNSEVNVAYSGSVEMNPDGVYFPRPPAFRQAKASYLGSLGIKLQAKSAEYNWCSLCKSNTADAQGPTLVCTECQHSVALTETPTAGDDGMSLQERFLNDFAELARRKPTFNKLLDIFDFLEQTENVNAFWEYVKKMEVQVPNGLIEYNGTAFNNLITGASQVTPRAVAKRQQALATMSTLDPVIVEASRGNYGNAGAIAAKAARIAASATTAGFPVDQAWVVKNGNKGPSQDQLKFYKNTGKIPPPGASVPQQELKPANYSSKAKIIASNAFHNPTPEQLKMVEDYVVANNGKGPTEEVIRSWSGKKVKAKRAPPKFVTSGSRFRNAVVDSNTPELEDDDLI
jgi:hypothetical protein